MGDYQFEDTIAAIATPIGEGGISVIRVSGPKSFEFVHSIISPSNHFNLQNAKSHTIHLCQIVDGKEHLIDQVLVSLFRAPNSYTGEDVVEISSHGGIVVTRRILNLLLESGVRHATPGEFTRRAFLNGKMDLTQAEAVLDVIKAKSEQSLDIASSHLAGSLSRKLAALKERLMKIYAHMEAFLDFPEDDLEVYDNQEFHERLCEIEAELQGLCQSFQRGSLLRDGISIAIIGRPNVGKSSLFNALLERDRAIVSEHAGTTRDTLEENIEIQGLFVRLIDTAGLTRDSKHPLDEMGIEKTRKILERADLFLFVIDYSSPITHEDREVFEAIPADKPVVVIANKSDLSQQFDLDQLTNLTRQSDPILTSSLNGKGLPELESRIFTTVGLSSVSTEGEQVTRLRHKVALETALEALQKSQKAFGQREPLDCVTIDLKASLDALKELVGETYSEDLLDVIFSEFCIGK